MRENQLSGYRHHPYTLEHQLSDYFLKGIGTSSLFEELNLETYADVLAPDRFRAMKNSLICFVAVISRSVITYGVDPENSFSLSDYYINEIERRNTVQELQELLAEIPPGFRSLIQEEHARAFSLPVFRALQYLNCHVYDACSIQKMAATLGYNPQYLATIFKAEVGCTPTAYIRQRKMSEARALLGQGNCPVAEVALSLGYCSASHFIREFKRFYGKTPKQYQKNGSQ